MGDKTYSLEVISPQGSVFAGEVISASLPAYNGMITVLAHHMPLFVRLTEGELEIRTEEGETSIVIGGGFCEVKHNAVLVLSDYAVRAESIELARAEEKKRKAEQDLLQKKDFKEFTIADKALRISSLEIKVSAKMRRKHR